VHNGDTMPYRVLLPLNFDPQKKYPLILFLHGAGERGNDNDRQLMNGGNLFLKDSIRQKYPAIVVFPQCPDGSYWSNVSIRVDSALHKRIFDFKEDGPPTKAMKLLMDLLRSLEDNYPLDKKRMYVGGLSMGGMGTYELVRRKPKIFAAAFAICGGANPATATKMTKPAWWIFHGLKDPVVPPQFSEDMAAALKQAGASVRLTIYPEDGHNSWDDAFKEPDLFAWMFSQKK
jgi:predicted peptidase